MKNEKRWTYGFGGEIVMNVAQIPYVFVPPEEEAHLAHYQKFEKHEVERTILAMEKWDVFMDAVEDFVARTVTHDKPPEKKPDGRGRGNTKTAIRIKADEIVARHNKGQRIIVISNEEIMKDMDVRKFVVCCNSAKIGYKRIGSEVYLSESMSFRRKSGEDIKQLYLKQRGLS